MPKALNLTGQRFGMVTVLRPAPKVDNLLAWHCYCDCGTFFVAKGSRLKSYKSCGCQRGAKPTHGLTHHPDYALWQTMKQRCQNANRQGYERYGGRGIRVCEAWVNSFEQFLRDMGPRPKGAKIERIDNDGPYAPENCRWATSHEQMQNTHRTHKIAPFGRSCTIGEAARIWGIPRSRLYQRLKLGWSPEQAVTTPVRGYCGR